MSATDSLRTYSDEALIGAINQLDQNGEWWQRLIMLNAEAKRRSLSVPLYETSRKPKPRRMKS